MAGSVALKIAGASKAATKLSLCRHVGPKDSVIEHPVGQSNGKGGIAFVQWQASISRDNLHISACNVSPMMVLPVFEHNACSSCNAMTRTAAW